MKNDYYIWQVQLPNYVHGRAFDEMALALHEAFRELGYDAPIMHNPYLESQRTAIVLGCNLLADYQQFFPTNGKYIFFNLEQVDTDSSWFTPNYLSLLKKYPVWDYSQANIQALSALGIEAKLCGIGYVPALTRIEPAAQEDIDVLFIGSINQRRKYILDHLRNAGLRVVSLFGVYGEERDRHIARAKIIINIHYYEAKVFEIVRCSYLMANRKFIVSEFGKDCALELPYKNSLCFCHYDELVERCKFWVDKKQDRQQCVDRSFDIFTKQSQVAMLRGML